MKKHLLLLWLLLCGSIGLAMAQSRTVTGVVKGPDGESLPGVTVVLKGTSTGASTGPDGAFSLTIPADNKTAVLRFSFIGYVSQEVTVGSRTTFPITLASDTQSLDDVVVIGYQEVRRGDVTSAISSVNAQQIKDIPVNSAAEALTGRLAGVQLTSSEGTPGNNNVQVRVRGGGSITQDNSPLYIVDGIQIENALSVIAPQDIASVDVLKDASSTAIYGARGANGVVIITTKNGREGRTSVTYNGFAGFRKITKTLGVMAPADYLNWEYERAQLVGTASGTTGNLSTFKSVFGSLNFNGDTLNRLRNLPNQDWQQQVFGRNAVQQTHNVAISGGTKSTTFNLSLTRNNENGIQLGSGYVRNLVNFRIDTKASDKFRLGFNARFNDQENLGAGTGAALGTSSTGQLVNTGSNTTSRLRNAVQYIPFNLPTGAGADPTANFDPDFFNNSTLINPVLVSNNEYRSDKRRTFNMGATAAFNILPSLVFRSTGGFDITYADLSTFNGYYSPTIRQAAGGYNTQPFITITDGLTTTLNNSNVLDYTFKKDKHTFTALLGEETYRQRTTQYAVQVNYFPIDITAERALANINQAVLPIGINAQPVLPSTTIPVDYGLVSGFTRLSYDYDGKYLVSASARYDNSSKFEPGNRGGVFPGASAAWRISQEDFFKDYLTKVSDLKLRVSYGQAGNNRIPDFLTKPLYQAGNVNYALNHVTTPATALTTLYNPDLKWEITTTRDVGVDVGLFNNRVQFTADVYYNTTHDLLISQPLPGFSGYTSQYRNIGSTSNKGLELQLSGTVVQTSNFTWTASANASFNRNKITDLGGLNEIPSIQSGWAGTALSGSDYVARVGQPVGQMYGYITDGFYTANDFKSYNYATRTGVLNDGVASDLSVTGNPQLSIGSLKLRDVNGDGQITEADKTVIGNANPKVIGGLNQQFTYKNFDASIFLNFVLGNDIYNANKIEFTTSTANTPYANLLSEMNNRVRYIDNSGALITDAATFNQVNANATMWSPVRGNYLLHSYAIEDGSFLRINNITVGYSLPKGLLSRVKVQSLRFYATLNNLYTFTKYSGYDPEVNTRRATPLTPGVDYAAYPRSRAFLFGLNLGL
ncbi:SusC/RagA family TonB-linked outer membrane protein [Hymenobacter cheonanensis]|uniref:SusC/RagA family TonB-linked outer membrane protein n=1 Tax=Hymenobacter sp. CA2-7 TaxID=3063993 RepID=UPI002713EB47|nr:TonB-dependent receptor [Hymenobacter sp. CA2-7]MDO7886676.1 TonB-dependent receptor [Hymenobacter sp. CA2-7]